MRLLNAAQVREAFPMADAIDVMRTTMAAHGRGAVVQPPRSLVDVPQVGGSLMLKPGYVGGAADAFGLKALTIFPDNQPSIQAFVALLDSQTGVLRAIVEGSVVTEVRTAAVSAVATDVLARRDAGDLAIVGAGVQGRSHLQAMAEVRTLRRVRLWNRSSERARAFVKWAASEGFEVESCPTVEAAVTGADLICTVTASPEPLVDNNWVAPGAHINAVGAYRADLRELSAQLVARAVVAVDSREGTAANAGDLVLAIKDGVLGDSFDPVELGELLIDARPGRTDDDQVTVFESLGLAIQDMAAVDLIYRRAESAGIGADVDFP